MKGESGGLAGQEIRVAGLGLGTAAMGNPNTSRSLPTATLDTRGQVRESTVVTTRTPLRSRLQR